MTVARKCRCVLLADPCQDDLFIRPSRPLHFVEAPSIMRRRAGSNDDTGPRQNLIWIVRIPKDAEMQIRFEAGSVSL